MNKGNIFYQELQKIGVDTEKGIRSCGEDEVFYREILQEYLKNSKERIIGLKSALDNEDMKNYSIMAHSLKSTSATIGAMELSLLAQKQEKAAIAKELDSVKADHSILMEKYSSLLNILEAYNHS